MYILNLCDNPEVLATMQIVKTIITLIRIIVPIILIVSIMLSYVGAIKDKDTDALTKANKGVIPKVVATFLVILIPSFVNLIADAVDVDKNMYISCIELATDENINRAYNSTAEKNVEQAYESINQSDYQIALNSVNKLKDTSLKNELLNKLKVIANYLDLKTRILSLESLKGTELSNRYKEVSSEIDQIKDSRIKDMFRNLLSQVRTTKPLDLKTGLSEYKKYESMGYYEVIPPHPTTNMPLWIFLHGDGGLNTEGFTYHVAHGNAYINEEFFYVAPTPIPFQQDWSGGNIPSNLKSLIDHLVSQYEIDKDRIIISGFSRGAIGTWTMVNNYPDLFSVAYPISCRPVGVQAKNFLTTVVRGHVGDVYGKNGGYEGNYADDMSSLVNEIKKLGGDATLTIYKGKKHGEVNYILWDKKTIEEALSIRKKR